MPTAHYDGVAAWYDEHLVPGPELVEVVRRLVGPGPGRCLDLCCGTGFHLATLHELGWTVTGIDISEDQLRLARSRAGDSAELLQGMPLTLPLPTRCSTSSSRRSRTPTWTISRRWSPRPSGSSRPAGGSSTSVPHPCFVGPHSRFVKAMGIPELHPGYVDRGRYTEAIGISPTGLRARVGGVHLPLGDLLQAFLSAGLRIEAFEEPVCAPREYPHWLALRAAR